MIAVHVGAGYHSQSKLNAYKQTCQDACKPAVRLLQEGGSANDAAVLAVSILENSSVTNAGLGSNLTERGSVEMDACVMTSCMKFGACGAVSRVKNPVKLAGLILDHQSTPQLLGRVPPCVLVGQGAEEWGKQMELDLCEEESLKNPASIHSYNKYMKHLKDAKNNITKKNNVASDCKRTGAENGSLTREDTTTDCNDVDGSVTDSSSNEVNGVSDTVGAVCIDTDGNMAAAASSGGILLKHPGRLGPAAMYGCGCWAENRNDTGVAIAASGCGEQLMQTFLVRDCASNVLNNDSVSDSVQDAFTKFITCERLSDERNAGLLVLFKDQDAYELVWTHSTQTMMLAYASIKHQKPVVEVSRNTGLIGRSCILNGRRWNI